MGLRRVLDLLRANVAAAPQHVESWNMLRDSLSRFIRVAKSLDHPAEADDASRELAGLLAHPPPP